MPRDLHPFSDRLTAPLTGITDEKGVRFATFGYDGSGRVDAVELAGGEYDYGVSYGTNDSTVTNPLGKAFTYRYRNIRDVRRIVQIDGASTANTPAASRYFNYDSLGRLIGMTDWENRTTRYEYDSRSNVTRITEAEGTADQRVTTISYIADFNLPDLVTTPGGLTIDYDYDVYGRLTTKTLTAKPGPAGPEG